MINEQRVRLMTRMSIYESRKGAEDERIASHFRGDYIAGQFLRSFVCATLAFILLAFAVCLYNFEDLMLTIYGMNLTSFVFRIVVVYLLFLIAFLTITFYVYSYRYRRAKRRLAWYYRELERLSLSYRRDEDYKS